MKNPTDSVSCLIERFLAGNDFSTHTARAFRHDLTTFVGWFEMTNKESFDISRVTASDITGFKDHLRKVEGKAVSTVNRAVVAVRRFYAWLVDEGLMTTNPCKRVRELRRQQLAPKGLDRAQARRLLREVELRGDVRANAIFHVLLYTGCRVSDLVAMGLSDVQLSERTGNVVFRYGKGNKQRTVPLPLPARKALEDYLHSRPTVDSSLVFIGERGPMTDRGIRNLCSRYGAICGFHIYPHLLRHSMAHRFLEDSGNDLVALAQILGHESIQTTARYTQRSQDDLAALSEQMGW